MRLRSSITRDGIDRTPHRAFMRGMGLDDAAIHKPMIGVVSMKGETTPCNMLDNIHPGLKEALTPDCRAGVYGQVLRAGRFRIGDTLTPLPDDPTPD